MLLPTDVVHISCCHVKLGARASEENLRFAKGDESLHLVDVNFSDDFAILLSTLTWPVHMDIHDVLSNHLFRMVSTLVVAVLLQHYPVTLLVVLILDDEYHIKPRQDSGLEIDVLRRNCSV